MINVQGIKEHMEVLGSDGKHVGTVDCTWKATDKIKLTKSDPKSGGQHHIIPARTGCDKRGRPVSISTSRRTAGNAQWQAAA